MCVKGGGRKIVFSLYNTIAELSLECLTGWKNGLCIQYQDSDMIHSGKEWDEHRVKPYNWTGLDLRTESDRAALGRLRYLHLEKKPTEINKVMATSAQLDR